MRGGSVALSERTDTQRRLPLITRHPAEQASEHRRVVCTLTTSSLGQPSLEKMEITFHRSSSIHRDPNSDKLVQEVQWQQSGRRCAHIVLGYPVVLTRILPFLFMSTSDFEISHLPHFPFKYRK